MRRLLLLLALATACLVAVPAAGAHHSINELAGATAEQAALEIFYKSKLQQLSALPGELGATSSPNVEYLGSIPTEGASATGGRLVGKYFYVTGWNSFSIYDVSEPLHPRLMSKTSFPFRFENEDVATNGQILLYSDFATSESLYVYDVRDKRAPSLLAELPGAGRHTMTCLFSCDWAYGSYRRSGPAGPLTGGETVDLRNPAKPRVTGDWSDKGVLPSRRVHDVFEVRPGRVLTASDPMELLDLQAGVNRPRVLATGTNAGERLHTVLWPRRGRDRFILSSFETNATPRCEAGSGEFKTWDAGAWRESGRFTEIDSFTLSNGSFGDGSPPANVLGCSPHWFEPRPGFADGGIVALAAYDNGTRFLRIDRRGRIGEVGHFLGSGTEASAAYWITDNIVYTVDYARGIDIVRFKG
jgi:LVIVD repeat